MNKYLSIVLLLTVLAWGGGLSAKSDVVAAFKVNSDWKTGFTASIKLTNKGRITVNKWTVEFDFDHTITSIWNAKIKSHSGSHYVIENADWNGSIRPRSFASFGFVGTPGKVRRPRNLTVKTDIDPAPEKNTVILVYRSLVNAYSHDLNGDAWTYSGDKAKRYYYHVLEFNPAKRTFSKNAYRIVYYDNHQELQKEKLIFNEYEKVPKVDGDKPYLRYVIGSYFNVQDDDPSVEAVSPEKGSYGIGEILYGNIILDNPVDIGWKKKVAVARSLKGKENAETPDYWHNFVLNSRLDSDYTKLANSKGLDIKEVVEVISEELKKKGYK